MAVDVYHDDGRFGQCGYKTAQFPQTHSRINEKGLFLPLKKI
jgi:hypothetical protein